MPYCCRAVKMTLLIVLAALLLIILPGCTKKNDISGTWKGKITLPQTGASIKDMQFILAQKGTAVTGTMIFTKPGGNLQLSGTVTDGKVTLSSPMKNNLSVTINGTIENSKLITGTAMLDYGTPLNRKPDKTVLEMSR